VGLGRGYVGLSVGERSKLNVAVFVVRRLGTWPAGLYRKGAVRQRKSGDGVRRAGVSAGGVTGWGHQRIAAWRHSAAPRKRGWCAGVGRSKLIGHPTDQQMQPVWLYVIGQSPSFDAPCLPPAGCKPILLERVLLLRDRGSDGNISLPRAISELSQDGIVRIRACGLWKRSASSASVLPKTISR
jgi:hypothetical protein